ncbi:MAG: tail fiber protein [Capsulimonas sp.]|uniref:phage tail protein n=1 Tax=Capsulimonas sp. TaxID=2494211 RepID=UPI0032653497
MSQPFVGEIRLAAFQFAPSGWAFCSGQLIPIAENDTLFNLIGTTYGGDGVSTFALPNMLGRVPVHAAPQYILGQIGGTETGALSLAQIPSHSHVVNASAAAANSSIPTGDVPAAAAVNVYAPAANLVSLGTSTGSDGQGQPHNNMMPFQCINYIISLFGIFPSQN